MALADAMAARKERMFGPAPADTGAPPRLASVLASGSGALTPAEQEAELLRALRVSGLMFEEG